MKKVHIYVDNNYWQVNILINVIDSNDMQYEII